MKWFFYTQLLGRALGTLLALGLLWLLCQASFAAHLVRHTLRPLAALLLLCVLCWPALTASAAAPARQACDERVAVARLRQVVEADQRGLTVPIGEVVAWSCVSTADAQATLDGLAADMRAAHDRQVAYHDLTAWISGLIRHASGK